MAPNAMQEEEKKKFKFWRPFAGIREKLKKFFSGNKKGNQSQIQGTNRQRQVSIFSHDTLSSWTSASAAAVIHFGSHFVGYENFEDWGAISEGGGGGGGSKKEMTLRNIYDIALTAIAYLSFGLFVLQVIMCITLVTHSR